MATRPTPSLPSSAPSMTAAAVREWAALQADITSGVQPGSWLGRALLLFVDLKHHYPVQGDEVARSELTQFTKDMDAWPSALSIAVWQKMYDSQAHGSAKVSNSVLHNHLVNTIMPRLWCGRSSDHLEWSDVRESPGMTRSALKTLAYHEHVDTLINAWSATSPGLSLPTLLQQWDVVADALPPTPKAPRAPRALTALWPSVATHPNATPETRSFGLLSAISRGHVRWAEPIAAAIKLPKHHAMWSQWYESAVIYGGAKLVDLCLNNIILPSPAHPLKRLIEQALSARYDDVSEAIWSHLPNQLDMSTCTVFMRNIGPKRLKRLLTHVDPQSVHTDALSSVVRYSGAGRVGDLANYHAKALLLAPRCSSQQIKQAIENIIVEISHDDAAMRSTLYLLVPFMTSTDLDELTKTNPHMLANDPAWQSAAQHAEISRHVSASASPPSPKRI